MQEAGVVEAGTTPSDEEIRRYGKRRKGKKVSNDEWVSPSDPDSRIARMKDGTTHLAYKAEHVVDLDTGVLLAAEVFHADESNPQTLIPSLVISQPATGAGVSPDLPPSRDSGPC
jgi:hypothetical protein